MTPSVMAANAAAPAYAHERPRPFYWSVRRELFENRFLYLAPLVVAVITLLAASLRVGTVMPRRMGALATLDQAAQHARLIGPLASPASSIMLCAIIVGVFYSIEALHGERRDRSILFWKSLPVSDRTVVLSKAAVPLLFLPLFAMALCLVNLAVYITIASMSLAVSGHDVTRLWSEIRFVQMPLAMCYGLMAHVLWYAPVYAWLMLISAWARRVPFVWAVVPLLAISAFEKLTFGTATFMTMLQYRVAGALREAFTKKPGLIDQLSDLNAAHFFTRPGLWLGLLFAAVCFAAAVRIRRHRDAS